MAEKPPNESTASAKLEELLDPNSRVEELSTTDEEDVEADVEEEDNDGMNIHGWLGTMTVPRVFLDPPFLVDDLVTGTSEAQEQVADACVKLLRGEEQEITDLNSHNIPKLQRQKHVKFLRQVLGKYPHQFQAMDASRPWLLYWGLAGLSALGEDVSQYRQRTIDTLTPMQNPTGGFGGGYGQLSHCAPSYAATLCLAMVDGLHVINRKTM